MADKESYVANFPSEIIKEGKVQVLVPKLEAYGVIHQIMRLLKLQSSTTQSWSSTAT